MDAIILAGGIPGPDEPLYPLTQDQSKSLLDIGGKPMVEWVIDALEGSSVIDRIVVVGLSSNYHLKSKNDLILADDTGSMLSNIKTGSEILARDYQNPHDHHAILAASDIPAITPAMVDWEAEKISQSDHDIYYSLITRQTMETRFPGSRRSFYKIKDAEVCGGDLNAIRLTLMTDPSAKWQQLVNARKNAFKQAALIGFDTLFMLLFRQFTIDSIGPWLSQRLEIKGRVFLNPYAETGMDIDKPEQLDLIRKDLSS